MAANHTKLIGLGVGAILAISAAPMYAVQNRSKLLRDLGYKK